MNYTSRIVVLLFIICAMPCMAQFNNSSEGSRFANFFRNRQRDLDNIGASAIYYRNTTRQLGGGQGSYVGYVLPKLFATTEAGRYSVYEALTDSLIIYAEADTHPSLIYIFDASGKARRQKNIYDFEMDKIGMQAYQYRIRSMSDGGGQGSYVGFKIPSENEWTIHAHYTIAEIQPHELMIQADIPHAQTKLRAMYNANGKRYTGDDIMQVIGKIQSLGYQYRTRPDSLGGGNGSYVGFTLPKEFDSTEYGQYRVTIVQPSKFLINVRPRDNMGMTYIYTVDSTGRMIKGPFGPKNVDSVFVNRYTNIVVDVKKIGKRAATYWNRTKPANDIPGSFEGFTLPDSLADTKNGKYSLVDIHDDMMHVSVVPSDGSRTEFFSIDRSGIEHYMVPNSYNPPHVLSSREEAFMNYKITDAKLNDVYKRLLDKNKLDQQFIKNLRNSERLWIKFRDAQLVEKYHQEVSIDDVNKLTTSQLIFLAILTDKRVKELQGLMEQ
jgi:uncharacterized protein YecT (DUF1311 family)